MFFQQEGKCEKETSVLKNTALSTHWSVKLLSLKVSDNKISGVKYQGGNYNFDHSPFPDCLEGR
jgi:hypothetical protein